MATEQLDYAVVLADLIAKRAALDATIANLRAFLDGSVAVSNSASGSTAPMPSGEVPAGAFLSKSIPEAATLYLQIMKRKASTKEIAEALKRGGMESTSTNFQGIVHAVLDRYRKSGGEIVKLDRSTWGLATWYPAGVRVTTQEKRPLKKARKAKPKGRAAKASKATEETRPASAQPVTVDGPQKIGVRQMIEAHLRSHPGQEFSNKELATALGLATQIVAINCSKMADLGKVEKTASGNFRATVPRAA